MTKKDGNIQYARNALLRSHCGFLFIDEILYKIHTGGTDAAWSRSVYLLMSYNFELLLKGLIIYYSDLEFSVLRSDKKFKSHNFEQLFNLLSKDVQNEYGILQIKKVISNFVTYEVTAKGHLKIVLEDFVDVRYDFEKPYLRAGDKTESERIKKEVDFFLNIINKINDLIF